MNDREYLMALKEYIEETEKNYRDYYGTDINKLIADGDDPAVYDETLRRIAELDTDDKLWNWFGLSYAGWLTIPRVLMHAMPNEWQNKMAALLIEWDGTWNTSDLPNTRVQAVTLRGKMTRFPGWVTNYRHPDRDAINCVRRITHTS